jgi:hypothetical protein
MNLIYGKCIRIEDPVNTRQMQFLMNELNVKNIYRMVFGSQHPGSDEHQVSDEHLIKDQNGRRITLMTKAMLFETSFEPQEQGYLMTTNMNLYTDHISRDEVISNVIAFKELLAD